MNKPKTHTSVSLICCLCLFFVMSLGLPAMALSEPGPRAKVAAEITAPAAVPGQSHAPSLEQTGEKPVPQLHEDDAAVFELGTIMLLGLGLIALGLARHKVRQ